MTRTLHHRTGATFTFLFTVLLTISLTGIAHAAAPDHRDDHALGRYVDNSDFGDWSSVLTQSLAILALHRSDAQPSQAAVDLLLAQQCDDGAFPDAFRAPSTSDPAPCVGGVDTTAFAVQALDAIGEDDAVADATAWLVAVQQEDGSFGGEDGFNSNSTGLAALALTMGGYGEQAQDARDWVLDLQDDCHAETPGAIPFRPGDSEDDRGTEVMSTSQAVLGLAGDGLGELDAGTASGDSPSTGCADDTVDEFGDPAEAATAFLVGELEEGNHLVIQGWPSEGATIDVLFALAAVEVGGDTIDAIMDWLDGQAAGYTQGAGFDAEDAAYAGATAKLALAAIVAGDDPKGVGGIDLIAQLESLEVTELADVTVSCDADEVAPGDEVECTLAGLLGGETVDVLVEIDPTLLDDTATADSSGTATFTFTVPEDATEGDAVTITVDGLGVDGLATLALGISVPEVDEPVDEVEADTTEDEEVEADTTEDGEDQDILPETGDHASLALGLGAASLLLGLGLVAGARRRQGSEHV